MSDQKLLLDIISVSTPTMLESNKKIFNLLNKYNIKYNFFNENSLTLLEPTNNLFSTTSPQDRFKNFQLASENPVSKILWSISGGYGSADILPYLYTMPKPSFSKILIGFSDMVTISSFVNANWGWKIICAPMLNQMINNKISQNSQTAIFDLILGKIKTLNYQLNLLSGEPQGIESEIVGGCLSVLINNFCTRNQLDWRNKILFLEDIGEDGERLDRYFTQIANVIIENNNRPKAILLGNFYDNNEFGKVKSNKIDFAIERFCKKLPNITIWQEKTFSLGHSFNQMPIILGHPTIIQDDGSLLQKINLSFF